MRNRVLYFVITGIIMVMGLLSRQISELPDWIARYSGDTLWAMMVFMGLAFLFYKQSTQVIGMSALIFSGGIEVSQLYHAPWIDELRGTVLGGLVLGHGFLWSDLVCYTIGILFGMGLDYLIRWIKIKKKSDRIWK